MFDPVKSLGLPWANVDLDREVIRIRQSLKVERGTKIVIGPLKTANSRRTLAAPTRVVDSLRAHRRRQLEERLAAGPLWQDTGLVFTTSVGTAINPRNFRRSFARLTEAAGLGHWHPHELRHSAVSLLSAAGVRLEDIADVVGHSTTRMTAEVYRHHVEDEIRGARDAMDRLFG